MQNADTQTDEKTLSWLYPTWKEVLIGFDEATTICIPSCHDVLKSAQKAVLDVKITDKKKQQGFLAQLTGQEAERAFLYRIQEFKLGGILVAGLDTKDFVGEHDIEELEWDGILFHGKRGIFVIEIKATPSEIPGISQKNKAVEQLDKRITKLKKLFEENCKNKCTIPVHGIICFPYRSFKENKIKSKLNDQVFFEIMDKDSMKHDDQFRAFFTSKPEWNSKISESVWNDFRKFTAFFVCVRSDCFISNMASSMYVAELVAAQDYGWSKKTRKKQLENERIFSSNGECGKIILTNEQLQIIESKEKCVCISGAPGTGKTLIIVMRALIAAKTPKEGNVVVFVNEPLISKFQQYFTENGTGTVREPLVRTTASPYNPEDDIFFDETAIDDSVLNLIEKRALDPGSTTVAFTGLTEPIWAATKIRHYYDTKLKNYAKYPQLKKVLRGTKKIFAEWGYFFEYGNVMGHEIDGAPVKQLYAENIQQAAQYVLSELQVLFSPPLQKPEDQHLNVQPKHVAVLTSHSVDAKIVGKLLDKSAFLNESISFHLKKSGAIAVDYFENAPSYEWPFVIIIFRTDDENMPKERMFPLAASRAIGKLIIIYYAASATNIPNSDVHISKRKYSFQGITDKTFSINPLSQLGGTQGTDQFCVQPDGEFAFTYDVKNRRFIRTDLNSGTQVPIDTDPIRTFRPSFFRGIRVVIRETNTYILAYIIGKNSNESTNIPHKYFVICFSVTAEKISIADEKCLDLECVASKTKENKQLCFDYIQQDGNNDIFCVSYWFAGSTEEKNTFFHTSKIDVDRSGKIRFSVLQNKQCIEGQWMVSFVYFGTLYCIPWKNEIQGRQLKKIVITSNDRKDIDVSCDEDKWPTHGTSFNTSALSEEGVFFFTINKKLTKGMVCHLDLKLRRWQTLPCDMNDHVLNKRLALAVSKRGFFYLHGGCSEDDTCAQKAHIYIYEKTCLTSTIPIANEISKLKISQGAQSPPASSGSQSNPSNCNHIGSTTLMQDEEKIELSERISADSGNFQKWEPGNNCETQKVIGTGSFGVVYRCWDKDSQRFFATKEVASRTDNFHIEAEKEIEILKTLRHPRIVEYYGYKIEHGKVYIFMECMEQSLRSVIDKDGPVMEETAISHVKQILEGLSYIHDKPQPVIHNDLKCENIALDRRGNVKLADFGIAVQILTDGGQYYVSQKTLVKGFRHFQAPEVIMDERPSRSADIWSLGCTIVEMLTTNPPYSDLNEVAFLVRTSNKTLSYDPEILVKDAGIGMKKFLSSLLQVEKSKRPRHGAEATSIYKTIF